VVVGFFLATYFFPLVQVSLVVFHEICQCLLHFSAEFAIKVLEHVLLALRVINLAIIPIPGIPKRQLLTAYRGRRRGLKPDLGLFSGRSDRLDWGRLVLAPFALAFFLAAAVGVAALDGVFVAALVPGGGALVH
jgi:hypothetical protein